MLHTTLLYLSAFSLMAMTFAFALFAFMVYLTFLRQQRMASLNYAIYYPQPAPSLVLIKPLPITKPVEKVAVSIPVVTKAAPIPEEWRLPIQAGSADQITILVKPDDTVSQEQPLSEAG